MGQAKLIGEEVFKLLNKRVSIQDIVIVLPQEHMLFPVLNAIPKEVEIINVTMGYPLKDTPLYGLLETAIELQEQTRLSADNGLSFYHKPALNILNNPYLFDEKNSKLEKLINDIRNKNQIHVFQKDILSLQSEVLNTIFKKLNKDESLIGYLGEIVEILGVSISERFGLEQEYLFHFNQLLKRLEEILCVYDNAEIKSKTLKNLLKKATKSIEMPFESNPVEGLQIMGVLETRNLDFKHVFMLNMNEDIFPPSRNSGSFIPYRIRKAFDIPTFEDKEAMYAYLFYRLFHHAENLSFFYNMNADFGLSGEISRYLLQLELETVHDIQKRKLSNTIQIRKVNPIVIETTQDVLEKLSKYTKNVPEKERRRLSASALNIYFDCKLKFYFRYVIGLFTGNEMSEELDARHFGNVVHRTLEYVYLNSMQNKASRNIDVSDFYLLESAVEGAMEKAFKEEFGMKGKKRFHYKDRNVVMSEIIKKIVYKVINADKEYMPFQVISLERENKYENYLKIEVGDRFYDIKLGAEIDRVDKKDGLVRIIDYKTGRDETEIGDLENLFKRDIETKYKNSRKAGFQTFFYAWLYAQKFGRDNSIKPSLFNIKKLFQPDFNYSFTSHGEKIEDVRIYLESFEENLKLLLEEIYDLGTPFSQTEEIEKCSYCEYKNICER